MMVVGGSPCRLAPSRLIRGSCMSCGVRTVCSANQIIPGRSSGMAAVFSRYDGVFRSLPATG